MNLMGNYNVLGLSDSKSWNDYINKIDLEQHDVYFTPEYHEVYEKIGDGLAQCFVYEEEGQVGLYPFLLNSINKLGYSLDKEYYDIQGIYGYNGILANSTSEIFFQHLFECFDNYCTENNIIAEFLRINPLLFNPLLYRKSFLLVNDRENIYVNLLQENIFETEYEYSTKKNVRKATKSGLLYRAVFGNEITTQDLDEFYKIYAHTMTRNNVSQYYFFNKRFFESIASNLKEKALFVFVLLNEKYISCEIVLLGSRIGYSFLGGTLEDYYQYRPNDFLKHHSIEFLKEKGFQKYLLGGGPDGVLRYKKSFSKSGVVSFFIGKKIHFKEVYDEVVNQWQLKHPDKFELYKNFALKYRY